MKLTFLQIGKKKIFPELIKYPAYGFNVRLLRILNVD